jgi:hypothetical protein
VGTVAEAAVEIAAHRGKNAIPGAFLARLTTWGEPAEIQNLPIPIDMEVADLCPGLGNMCFPNRTERLEVRGWEPEAADLLSDLL